MNAWEREALAYREKKEADGARGGWFLLWLLLAAVLVGVAQAMAEVLLG